MTDNGMENQSFLMAKVISYVTKLFKSDFIHRINESLGRYYSNISPIIDRNKSCMR